MKFQNGFFYFVSKFLFLTLSLTALFFIFYIFKIESAFAANHVEYITEFAEPNESYKSPHSMRVAVIQANPGTASLNVTAEEAERLKSNNRDNIKRQIEGAANQGAEWIITSEMGVVGYPHIPGTPSEEENFRTREEILPYAETIPGPTTEYFSALAKKLNIHLQVGFPEIDPVTQKLYNAAVLIKPDGNIAISHRKNSLFHVEGNYFSKGGTTPAIYDSPIGKVGILICADVYDYTLLRYYQTNGVKVLNLSTSWAQMNTGMGYFQRAAQNVGAYLLAANQPYFPDSGVINPNGENQSHIRQTSGTAFGFIPYINKSYPACSKLFN